MGRWIQLTLFRSEAPISLDNCQHLLEKDAELQIHIKRFSFAFFRDKAMIGNKTLQKWEATTKKGVVFLETSFKRMKKWFLALCMKFCPFIFCDCKYFSFALCLTSTTFAFFLNILLSLLISSDKMEHLSCSSNQQKGKQQIYTATITNNTRAFHISGWNVAPNAIPSHKQIYLKKFMQPFFASAHIFFPPARNDCIPFCALLFQHKKCIPNVGIIIVYDVTLEVCNLVKQ